MGRRSKATLARLNNFSKPINPQNPIVEEVFDDENTHFEDEDEDFLEHGFILSPISYANRAARFISAYGQGLSGPEAAWANRKYHGHRTLPPEMATKLKKRTR